MLVDGTSLYTLLNREGFFRTKLYVLTVGARLSWAHHISKFNSEIYILLLVCLLDILILIWPKAVQHYIKTESEYAV